jgi:hypothetical protein
MSERSVAVKYLIIVGGLLALACLVVVILFKDLHQAQVLLSEEHISEYPDIAFDIGIELFKTIFIGVCLGVGVEVYLKQIKGDSTKVMLEKSGIMKVYATRNEAKHRLEQLIDDRKRVKNIYVAGISLREFLTEQGSMRSAWEAIQERLADEENTTDKNKLTDKDRLHVYLLILDPRSGEGYFRYRIEKPHSSENPKDIEDGLNEVRQVQESVYNRAQSFLQVRLYEHCPFSFVFLTDTTAYVEGYYYKKRSKAVPFPLIEYSQDSPHYSELRRSLEVMWEHAYTKLPLVGTAVPVKRAGIKNIFRVDKRREQAKRQVECIRTTDSGTIDILTITGRHYVNDSEAIEAIREAAQKKDVKVRFALLNPVCQQAIFRAIADVSVNEKMKKMVASYDWNIHKQARLYHRIYDTIGVIENWREEGLDVEFRLYSCSAGSALLLTPESSFAGKYVYGRSKKLQGQAELHSEYPMFEFNAAEFETRDQTELEILECTFKVIWDHYSISYEVFKNMDDREEFNKNLTRLKEELAW